MRHANTGNQERVSAVAAGCARTSRQFNAFDFTVRSAAPVPVLDGMNFDDHFVGWVTRCDYSVCFGLCSTVRRTRRNAPRTPPSTCSAAQVQIPRSDPAEASGSNAPYRDTPLKTPNTLDLSLVQPLSLTLCAACLLPQAVEQRRGRSLLLLPRPQLGFSVSVAFQRL